MGLSRKKRPLLILFRGGVWVWTGANHEVKGFTGTDFINNAMFVFKDSNLLRPCVEGGECQKSSAVTVKTEVTSGKYINK